MSIKQFYACLAITIVLVSASYADWKSDANDRIEQMRKGDFKITVLSPYGSHPSVSDVNVQVSQRKHQFAFGSCINSSYYTITSYANFFKNHFEWAVCENNTKWKYIESSKDVNNYTTPDGIYNWCTSNGIKMRGHCLFWDVSTEVQSWVNSLTYATYPTSSPLLTRVDHHIFDTMTHYTNKFANWDIDNEIMNGGFYNRLGSNNEGRVHMYQYARQVDPNCKLFMNEYGGNSFEGGYDTGPYVNLANSLISNGAPIDGFGIQAHISPPFSPENYWTGVLKPLGALGRPIWATEFDYMDGNEIPAANVVEDFYRICFSDPNVEGIIMWGFWKGHTWRNGGTWGIVEPNWTPNQATLRYESLMNEWTTNSSAVTDDNGNADFRGFYGKYNVKLKYGGVEPNVVIDIVTSGPNEFTITLPNITPTTCWQVQDLDAGLGADLNGDCYVNYKDLEIVAYYWLNTNCGSSDNCEGADFVPTNGTVDFADFSKFANDWSKCNNPEDSNCTPSW